MNNDRPNHKVFYLRTYYKFNSYRTFSGRPLNLGYSLELVQTGRSILVYKDNWTLELVQKF